MRKAYIDLKALQHNLDQVRTRAPRSKVIAMIKSQAYGHGLIPVSLALSSADAFGVACLSEAIQLREAGIEQRILLMSGFNQPQELPLIDRYQLDMVIHQKGQVVHLNAYPFQSSPQIWVKVNTGMNRLGFLPEEVEEIFDRLSHVSQIRQPVNWMMHFANSDQPGAQSNQDQLKLFRHIVQHFPGEKSAANSGAIIAMPEAHFDWIRPGIMLYGISPFAGKTGQMLGLKSVMTLLAQLISVYTLNPGDAVGYGSTWTCPEKMPVGIISLGYGDGYPRSAAMNAAVVCIQGALCPLIGRVSMDLMAVDLRPCPKAQIGDEVILWGEALPVERLAETVGTIGYELVCRVTQRVVFEYEKSTSF